MNICKYCIGDAFLLKVFDERSFAKGQCTICQSTNKCLDLELILPIVEKVILKHFTPVVNDLTINFFGSQKYYRFEQLCSAVFNGNWKISRIIQARLENSPRKDDENNEYIPKHTWYQDAQDCIAGHQNKWNKFCDIIKHRQRFFNTDAKAILDSIFQDLRFSGIDAFEITTTIREDDEYFRLYRGRLANTDLERNEILSQMPAELGPPPKEKATHGRMNPKGISFMYMSFDRETCISELRPYIGAQVITGAFSLNRPLQLLDLGKISFYASLLRSTSYFDPDSIRMRSITAFLRGFEKMVTKSFNQQNSEMDYLPTQAFAEYLSSQYSPKLDGIIYSSSQTIPTRRNIALFPDISQEYFRFYENESRTPIEVRLCESDSTYEVIGLLQKSTNDAMTPAIIFDTRGTKVHRVRSLDIQTDDHNCSEMLDGANRHEDSLFSTDFMKEANEEMRRSIKNR